MNLYLDIQQGKLCLIKELLVFHFLGEFLRELLLPLQSEVKVQFTL